MKELAKTIYRKLPLKRPVFELARRVIRPPEGFYKHLHFEGDFRVKVDDAHSFLIHHYGFEIENDLFWAGLNGGWEQKSTAIWIELVRRAEIIFDIGANTGVYSLIAKSLRPDARVYAIEPVKRVFEKLVHNVDLNRFDISCIEAAASNSDGTATIYDTPTDHIYSVTVNENRQAADTEVIPTEIRTIRLDTLIQNEHLSRVDLMKIDVETHEPEVLEGMGEYLNMFRPTMLIEILSDEVGARVESLVHDCNYLFFNIDDASNSVRRVEHIRKSDFYNYLLINDREAQRLQALK